MSANATSAQPNGGYFQIGGKPGPGRKPGPQWTERKYRQALVEAITPEDLRDVAANLLRIAKGDHEQNAINAAKVILSFLCPPVQRIELAADIEEVKTVRMIADVVKDDPTACDAILALTERVRAAVACGPPESGGLRNGRDQG